MKESILKNIRLSIEGRDVKTTLTGDNTKEGGKEAYRAAKIIGQMFINNDHYDSLSFIVMDRADPRHTLWHFKLQLHDGLENYVFDMEGGEFLTGLSA